MTTNIANLNAFALTAREGHSTYDSQLWRFAPTGDGDSGRFQPILRRALLLQQRVACGSRRNRTADAPVVVRQFGNTWGRDIYSQVQAR